MTSKEKLKLTGTARLDEPDENGKLKVTFEPGCFDHVDVESQEELDELMELSDRIHVIANGRLSPSIARMHATVDQIGVWMSGLWDDSPRANQETAHVSA